MKSRMLTALLAGVLAPLVQAQVGLPGIRARLPQLQGAVSNPINRGIDTTVTTLDNTLTAARRVAADSLIRNHRQTIEADVHGNPVVRSRLLAVGLTDDERARILAAGFTLQSSQTLAGLGLRIGTFGTPPGQSTRSALRVLLRLAPKALVDYDHIYAASGEAGTPARALVGAASSPVAVPPTDARIGLIDGGIARLHKVFRNAQISGWGCGGRSVPSAHGTEVASLLVGAAGPFRGAAPGAHLYAADVYCAQPTGGAVETVVAALGWLAQQRVPVINISLVGPDNAILRQVVQALVSRGYLLVAAVGNDGPAAPPLYPAAYAGVVGVTAVDAKRHVLLEAERGSQVTFAAPGADMAAAQDPQGYVNVRGTSFAAPLVAGLLAAQLTEPDRAQAQKALDTLIGEAMPVAASRNERYGYGLVGMALRVAPALVSARHPP